MFLSTDKTQTTELPRDCTFSESDWHILAGFRHPVAFSSAVTDKPVKAKLLDMDLVLYRTVDGIAAARDLCVHRGAALSLGWMDDACKNIVCPFHGLHYDRNGVCTKVPSMPDQTQPIPRSLRLISYQAEERYGLIWVCMKPEALRPIPDWPLLSNPTEEWTSFELPVGHWKASASRHCENFNDAAHLSWVHTGTFGNRDRPAIPNYKIEMDDNGMSFGFPYVEVERGFRDGVPDFERDVYYIHRLSFPFATDLQIDVEEDDGRMITNHAYDIGSPTSARETTVFQIFQTNVPNPVPEEFANYQVRVNEEDIVLVESQRPEEVPLNISEEMHIPADKFSIQYRKALVRLFGLGSPQIVR
ncbi:MAG: Rieske 2Fe-2S domain-containing protein [Rhodobacteraceae bacterium]|nr:Rieske 2Fe-2S domain-containing protein [Paracoccaceae bacterium]